MTEDEQAAQRIVTECTDVIETERGWGADLHRVNTERLVTSIAAALRAQREALENQGHQTVVFTCGCIFRQDGLDSEPRLIAHCKGELQ